MNEDGAANQAPAQPPEARTPKATRHRRAAITRPLRRAVDLGTVIGMVGKLPIDGPDAADRRRRLLAEVCKVFGDHLSNSDGPGDGLGLPPRLRQTLKHLIRGDSEKQVARQLGLSPHTIHVYVKQLYKRLHVSSRGELIAKFVRGTRGT